MEPYTGHDLTRRRPQGERPVSLEDPNLPDNYRHINHVDTVRTVDTDATLPEFGKTSTFGASTLHGSTFSNDEEKVMGSIKETELVEENSPYLEVQVAVPNRDEDLPVNTIRAWVLGLTLSMFGAGINTFFSLRNPAISISVIVAQLLAFFAGRGWQKIMPDHEFNTFGLRWNLNPGHFNYKEHTLVVVMANVSFGIAYATDIILAQVSFYKQDFGMAFQILLVVTTQCIGYGIAGVLRQFLVYPAAMIWPSNLMITTMIHTMHEKDPEKDPTIWGGNMSRYRWFFYVFLASFAWYFFPGYIATFLSVMVFPTWIRPNDPVVNQVFGGTSGLGLIPLTFDWTTVTGFIGDPLVYPWHAIANIVAGVLLFYVLGGIGLSFGGAWYAKYLPISDSATYDNTAKAYNVSRVVTKQLTLNVEAYKAYSPLYISTTFAIAYGLSFAAIAAMVVHVYLYHKDQIIQQFRNSREEKADVHMKMMLKYRETPLWWYLAIFGLMIALSLVTILVWPTQFAWWAFLFAVLFSTIMCLPVGIIQAITNQQVGLNVITEFIMGYMQPGKPLALMLFKTYGYITATQALSFVSDLKLGHYMKIPPRTMFSAQVAATLVSCLVQVYVLKYALTNIEGVCTPHQANKFTCPGAKVFYSASVIWGLLGPGRIFSPGQTYSALLWGFPLGAITPLIFYFAAKKWPRLGFKHVSTPVLFSGGGNIPPATAINYLSWGFVGWFFQRFLYRRHFKWWSRLNYITGAGLDTGLAISTLFIYFAFTMTKTEFPAWW
jgi:OPT family small oligopeptide transporter